ncbi:uncharacterized protein IL334_002547 [Kwoniella shivajii]|uniref:Protein UNC80 C-terminal domain-containing protein n=1 Tax=Kwoniella shivajii TaxID=564305 RepID=A0ABZ1CV16_9TREE|nr:hypothetical protein IL334_002547 [Kwoniella shivajii]
MADQTSPPPSLRQGKRIPSGPRPPPLPLRGSPGSSRVTSASSLPKSSAPSLRQQSSFGSLSKLLTTSRESPFESPLDALIDTEHDFTTSPDSSPRLEPLRSSSKDDEENEGVQLSSQHGIRPPPRAVSPSFQPPSHAQTITALPMSRETSKNRAQTLPDNKRPSTPTGFIVSRPSTPTGITSPPKTKTKPKPSRLNTSNLMTSTTSSPTRAVSPGMKHWQQVRSHVIAPTPVEERVPQHHGRHPAKKMTGLVSKAAGRFGFRHAAENVIGYNDRRNSMMGIMAGLHDLSKEEKESITRERRKFARDVKTCLDACALEESKRRLAKLGYGKDLKTRYQADTKSSAVSMHTSVHTSSQKFTFDPEFSAFAPLLMELHKHLPAARAKKPWSRTCPHHSAILAELGSAFLQDSTSTDGERQQALEVFGVVVKSWAADNADEELERWLWLSRALLGDDRQLRNRGLALLNRFLHPDSTLPRGPDRPRSALAFISLAGALIQLLYAVEMSGYGNEDHLQMINGFLADLSEGDIIDLEETSLVELLGSLELGGSMGGIDKELVWMAVGMIIGTQPFLAPWLLIEKGQVLQRFYPPPILHATPPLILNLRSRSLSLFFTSYSSLISSSTDVPLATRLWRSARDILILEVEHLPDEDGALVTSMAAFLFELELQGHKLQPTRTEVDKDPFRIAMEPNKGSKASVTEHRETLASYSAKAVWKGHFDGAAKRVSFLQTQQLTHIGKECVNALFERLVSQSIASDEAKPFLTWLSKSNPQLLYKPLFSCSAAISSTSLLPNLKLVHTMSELLGPAKFWTRADPHMMAIVLMGDVTPKQPKGKGKEGEKTTINVKLGRYAVLIGFIEALENVHEPAGSGSRLRAFIEGIEARLSVFLEAEEKDGSLPEGYRSLISQLFLKMRAKTSSIKKSSWMKLIMKWFIDIASADPYRNAEIDSDNEQLVALKSTFTSIAAIVDAQDKSTPMLNSPPAKWTSNSLKRDSLHLLSDKKRVIFDTSFAKIAPFLLVTIHATLSNEDWEALLPRLWHYYDSSRPSRKALTFLIEKCAEKIPASLRAIIISDLTSSHSFIRNHALSKIAMLFGWRFQVLAQRILTDRRGPIFQFTSKTLEFVATEIGSPDWVPSQDLQDAALQKFGRTLPLELRQRLMELGWSEDESLQAKSDWEQVPVSSLPALQYQQEGMNVERTPSPMRSLTRRGSSGSGNSFTSKRRKAVFSPTLLSVINQQACTLAGEIDGSISTTSQELVKLLQRDDPTGLLRPIAEGFVDDFVGSLARLNSIITTLTPGFAYAALNALVGHVKTILRNNPHFEHHALALATISRLVPGTSEISLRDIRKNKAEHVLLPASIHEDEGGFKVHAPWRDGQINIQTSQLLILTEALRANPREVYLFKKMLSNLQIGDSIPHLPFARAWLILVSTLFSAVNRNYNDRAELRHFLTNVGNILRIHGQKDILVAAHAMRVFMLCAARFRRLFTSMGFSTIMRPVYDTYAGGNTALRDCIEYASRGFYRIHQDSFVHQTCVVISEGEYDASAVYSLLESLSRGNTDLSGVPSGIKDLNNQEEIEALVQMLSGPEIAFSEIGQGPTEKQASKQVSITLEDTIFPKENIIKLFVTVIAANPATIRAANFLRLLASLVPHIKDPKNQDLLREGVEALGSVIQKGKTGDEAAMLAFHPGSEETTSDWVSARREYVFLVESFARSGGQLGASATKRTLDMVLDLLRKQPESVGPAASSIVTSLAKTHLSSSRPTPFLRDIAPLFRMFIAVVDFSGVLDSITALIKRSSFDLDTEITSIIVDNYVEPAVRMLASASEESMAFIVPLRSSAVRLLSAAVFLNGDALGALERHPPGASLLASLVLPLCLLLETPQEVDREAVYSSLWIRLLHYILKPRDRQKTKTATNVTTNQVIAATAVLTIQIIKIIIIRATESISSVKGLWTYISSYLLRVIEDGDALFAESAIVTPNPRIVDWMMWSLFELLSLHKNPLMIHIRSKIQSSLLTIHKEVERSNPPSPGLSYNYGHSSKMSTSMSMSLSVSNPPQLPFNTASLLGRARRISSARTPSAGYHSRLPSSAFPDISNLNLSSNANANSGQHHAHSRAPSHNINNSNQLTPEFKSGTHSRMPSQGQQFLTPFMNTPPSGKSGHGRMPSQSSLSAPGSGTGSRSGSGGYARPSFAALSARRASKPVFDVFQDGVGMNYRFPSSAGIRNLNNNNNNHINEKSSNTGAIVHLLSTPNQVLSATSIGFPTISPTSPSSTTGFGSFAPPGAGARNGEIALRKIRIKNEKLSEMTRKAVRTVKLINGYDVDTDDDLFGHGHGNGNGNGSGDDEDEDGIKNWNVLDALHTISEQTRLFVEEEFRDLFSPSSSSSDWTGLVTKSEQLESEKEYQKRESGFSLAPEGYRLNIEEEMEMEGIQSFSEKRRSSEFKNTVPLLSVSED